VVLLGIVLVVIGALLDVGIVLTLGVVILVVGAILFLLGSLGRPLGGRRHWW